MPGLTLMTVSWAPRAATFIEVKKQASTGIWPTRKLHIRSRTNQSLDIWVFGVVGADALSGISRSVVEPPISVWRRRRSRKAPMRKHRSELKLFKALQRRALQGFSASRFCSRTPLSCCECVVTECDPWS